MSDKPVLFSVIIPTYNRAAFIEAATRSVQNQVYKTWELIIVDDGSTDETENIVKAINDERIKYVSIANSERGAARNAGIKIAKGDIICFLDSDDLLLSNHLMEAFEFITKNPGINVFHQGYEIRSQNGKILFSSQHLPLQLNKELVSNNVISPNGIFIRADIAKQNLFIEDRALAGTEDYELWLRLASRYPIIHNPVFTSVLIDHEQRSMKETDIEKLLTRIHLFIKYVNENKEVKKSLGSFSKFKAWRFSYIALHASLTHHKKIAFKYLRSGVAQWTPLIFTRRFFVICKNIFIR